MYVYNCTSGVNIRQASKTFNSAWEPEFKREIAFEHFEVKTPLWIFNLEGLNGLISYGVYSLVYMTDYFLNVPSQKFPVPKITKQTKSHSLNFNVLSSVIDSSGEEVWVSFDSDNYFYVKTWFE